MLSKNPGRRCTSLTAARSGMQNLVRGRGLLCRSLMKSQMASPTFTPIFAALVSVINTKFPEIGELLLHRLILQASSPAQYLPQSPPLAAAGYLLPI